MKSRGVHAMTMKKSLFSRIMNVIYCLIIVGFVSGLFLMYGPYSQFRDWYITTAMKSMNHQYLATYFFSSEAIAEALNNNKIVEVQDVTDTSMIQIASNQSNSGNYVYASEEEKQVLEKEYDDQEYKIVKINEDGYSGYMAVIYDASKIKTMVTKNLNKSGQYVTTMAQEQGAKLAINGGFFVDLKENRKGGTPLGITIADGEVLTNSAYNDEGGLVGFTEDNKLVVGKMTLAEAQNLKVRDAVTAGPFLIVNGESSQIVGNGGWGTQPRTAIGQRQDGIVIMVVIDGRRVSSQGATMNQLIKLMEKYHVYNAAALDGGTSSVMVENGELLNDPIDSDGKHKTRPVATAFGVFTDESSETTKSTSSTNSSTNTTANTTTSTSSSSSKSTTSGNTTK